MSDAITNTVEKVDPERAVELLAMNKGNRNVSQPAVKKMASDMEKGLWVYDGSPIRISSAGALLDGQHRLYAVIKSGLPQEFLIIRGLPDKVMQTMDQGRKRSSADAWQMVGGVYGGSIAAAVRVCIRYTNDKPTSTVRWSNENAPSQSEVNEWLMGYRDWIESVLARTPFVQMPVNRSTVIALALLVDGKSLHGDKWEGFCDVVRNGLGTGERDPRVVLRNYAIRGHGHQRSGDLAAQVRLATYVKAWNAYVEGKEIGILRWRVEEGMPRVL